MSEYLLSLIVFSPLLGGILLLFLKDKQHVLIKQISLVFTIIPFAFVCFLWASFDASLGNKIEDSFQFVEKWSWISLDLGSGSKFLIEYHLGVDGISIGLILLASIILVIGVIASWRLTKQVKGYFLLYMLLSTSILGCFLALDFFLFYLFFELMLLPMFFLIGIWGGPKRAYASIKFFIYTLIGSLLILIVMIALYLSVSAPILSGDELVHSFNILLMMNPANYIDVVA
jgi:NADH:ubiquinone oxidoreductase subunit 4 (chain M)